VAARLLGLPHRIRGTVVSGDQRGRTIGFPTANLLTDAQLLPSNGVYAVHASVDGGEWLPAVANLGERPTFDGRRYLIEVHLLDFSADLYGHELQVGFIERLRSEQRFDGPDALAAQIRLDVQAARSSLERSQ
jgi:riboflavin kinase/FMN adenylyltransferase